MMKKTENIVEPKRFLFTSESVTEGHPDKIADQIADHVLDSILEQDKKARVACEVMVTKGIAIVTGEITTTAYVEIPDIVRETIHDIGYTDPALGFAAETCGVLAAIGKQSQDIAVGVDGKGIYKEQGAGDQGMMFGYACTDTPVLMPMPIVLAHGLTRKLSELRKSGKLNWLRPDGKSQVTVEYVNGKPHRAVAIVVAAQHDPDVDHETIKNSIVEEVIRKVVPESMLDDKTEFLVNTTGRFVVGGPVGDSGVTGRKIIADTYGGFGYHGGGAFSGKDPSKVDRSASYMCRYIAKNIVAAGLAKRCELQIAYTIGKAQPVAITVTSWGTGVMSDAELTQLVRKTFDLRPASIIEKLNLLRPIYRKTTNYGHFGRELPEFTWEKTDCAEELKRAAK
jgi:S-adenosylmethionine synthetase